MRLSCGGALRPREKMSEKQFTEECLAVMNKYRAIHQAAPLSYDRGLEQVAKQWATHLTKTNTWAHNPNANYKGKVLGENIASHWTSNNEGYKGKLTTTTNTYSIVIVVVNLVIVIAISISTGIAIVIVIHLL